MDPQGNLTQSLAHEMPADDDLSIADTLSVRDPALITDVIRAGEWEGVDIAPVTPGTLAVVRDQLLIAGASNRTMRLSSALSEVSDLYDVALIDSPPSLDLLALNAIAASNWAYIITHASLYSVTGLARLTYNISVIQEYHNSDLKVGGIIKNQYEEKTKRGRFYTDELTEFAESNGIPVLAPPIPKRIVIAESAESATPLDEIKGDGGVAAELSTLYSQYLDTILGTTG
jgi:chromosome partitioning protein